MIKIGDFSKLAHVSVKTLHHYDDLGLLKPVHVDRYSGYRYYEIGQLRMLNRILALKDLGLSLEQVAELLHEDLSTAEMRGMLRLKQMELAERVDEEQARLLRVEQRLRQLEVDGCLPQSEIAVKDVPAQTALVAQVVAASEDVILPARQSLQALLQDHLEAARLKPATPWFTLFDDLPYQETDLELTLAVGVELRSGQRAGDWLGSPIHLQELKAVPAMASVIHTGDYATLPQAYAALYTWTQRNGYQSAGSYRELYLPESGVSATPIGLLLRRLDAAEADVTSAVGLLWSTPSVGARFQGVGAISSALVREMGFVGVAARAAGVPRDVRHEFPAPGDGIPEIPVRTEETGDVQARARLRWREIQDSLAFVRRHATPLAADAARKTVGAPRPDSIAVALVEGWRGEICHVALTDGDGRFTRYKIVDPSFHNWGALAHALRDQQISDFPLCNKSFDLSYCGQDL